MIRQTESHSFVAEVSTYVDDSVLEYSNPNIVEKDSRLGHATAVLKLPVIPLLVELEFRSVVSFVEILENAGEDFRLFVRKVDPTSRGLEELASTETLEVRRVAQDVLMGSEETLLTADTERYDGTGEGSARE